MSDIENGSDDGDESEEEEREEEEEEKEEMKEKYNSEKKDNNDEMKGLLDKKNIDLEDEKLNAVISKYKNIINIPHAFGSLMEFYNFPLPLKLENSDDDINDILKRFLSVRRKKNAFKMNFSVGTIVMHKETRRYRYFAPGSNNNFFTKPLLVEKTSHMPNVSPESYDYYMNTSRSNTKWMAILPTNIQIRVYPLTHTMG